MAPVVQLEVVVRGASGELGRWQGQLPAQPGGIWIDPTLRETDAGPELLIRAATPREEAFLSLVSPQGRFFGAIVAMQTDDRGFSSARVVLPPLPQEAITILVSGGAGEAPADTSAWPLRPRRGSVSRAYARLLVDGMPAAIAAEERRQTEARRPAYGLVLAAGLFELLYLWRRRRASRRRLSAHLTRASEKPDGEPDAQAVAAMQQSMPLLWLTLLMGGLALMFAILAALTAWA